MQGSPNRRLVALVRGLPRIEAHNRLMRLGDREIALAMMYMENPDRSALLALLPAAKARRVREEMALHSRLAIRYDQYLAAVEHVLEGLRASPPSAFRSYLRPRRSRPHP